MPKLQRVFQPWGDGYVRMPVQRHVFNASDGKGVPTGGRTFRTGRRRRPNKPTYPTLTTTVLPPLGTNGLIEARDDEPHGYWEGLKAMKRDEAIKRETAVQADAKIAADQPKFGWSHLDDYEGLAYLIQGERENDKGV